MKSVRNILLFFAVLFGFILQAEVYQSELWNFDSAYYKTSKYQVSTQMEEKFLKSLQKAADKKQVSIFTTYMETNSRYQATLHIYGNSETIKNSLYRVMRLEERTYTSLMNGNTNVEFHPFEELKNVNRGDNHFISYIGDDKDIQQVFDEISSQHDVTSPQYWQSTEKDMIIVVWGMIAIFMVILNAIEVIRRKKEIVIRRSLGESESAIVLKSVAIDVVSYTALYVLAKTFSSQFVQGEYEQKLVLIIYILGTLMSLMPYCAFFSFDVRKAFSNVNEEKGVLYLLYGLKIVATACTIFTISTNLSSIRGNFFADSSFLKPFYKDTYFAVNTVNFDEEAESQFWETIYKREYKQMNPVVCINVLEDKSDYILVNKNAREMLQGFSTLLDKVNKDADVVVFIPKGKDFRDKKALALEQLNSFLVRDMEAHHIKLVKYDKKQVFSYLKSSEPGGIAKTTNPVIIYQCSDNIMIKGANVEKYAPNEIIFRANKEKINDICKKYHSILGAYSAVQTKVYDAYMYNYSFMVKLISFLSSLCVLILILNIAVIMAINKMEYRTKALEISLKKVIGYSLYERHKKLFLFSFMSDAAIILSLCIISLFMSHLNSMICIITGLAVTGAELIIICGNMIMVEKQNIQKTLKGGCL